MARKRAPKSLKLDFSGVEVLEKMDEGEQLLKVSECSLEEGDKAPYYKWVMENEDGAKVWHNTSTAPKSLWNLKAWLEALGIEVEDEMEIDLEDMVDKELMASIEMETFEGKKRPRIVDFWPAEEEKDKKGGKKDKDAGDDLPTEEELDDMDEKALKKVVKKFELTDVDPDDYPKEKKLRAAILEALEGLAKASKKGGKGKKGKDKDKPTEDEVNDMNQDELEDVIKEQDLGVDLGDFKTLRKMKAAVIEALDL